MSRLPPLVQLRAFDAVARHMSFKLAAEELGVTPTAISHQIRLLEQYCGCSLFRRRPRPLSLTEEGAQLFPVIRDGLEAFATTIASVRRSSAPQPLRITTTNAFAGRWLVPRLPSWRVSHPGVPLELIGTDNVLDIRSGEADVAIRYARRSPHDGISHDLLADTFYPVCSPDLSPSGFRRAADLRKHVLVHAYWPPSDIEAPTWQNWLAKSRQRWRNVPEFAELQHLSFREELHAIEAVLAGQGVGLFSDVLVAPELASGALVKAFDLNLTGYHFFVARRAGHPREKLIGEFIDWLETVK